MYFKTKCSMPLDNMLVKDRTVRSFIHSLSCSSFRGCGGCWSLSQCSLGRRQDTPRTGYQGRHTDMHIHSHLVVSDSPDCMPLDCVRKPRMTWVGNRTQVILAVQHYPLCHCATPVLSHIL